MLSWFRYLIAAAGTFGVSWAGAVWYWRANNVAPGTGELALLLVALPAMLLAGWWAGRKVYEKITAPKETVEAPAVQAPPPAPPAISLTIAAALLRMPHGASPQDLAAALAEGEARPALDDDLLDDYGYPVMAARIADLDDAAVREEMTAWLAGRDARFAQHHWRALATGSALATELGYYLAAHPEIDAHAARTDKRTPSPLPMLQLCCAWAPGWTPAQREITAQWFSHLAARSGWPADRIAIAPDRGAADDAATILQRLLAAENTPVLAALIACDSHIGAAAVDRLAAADVLFTARHQQGQVPGEGAAALLLADAAQAAMLAYDSSTLPMLRAVASAQRDASADTAKRVDTQTLPALCTQALERAQCTPAQIAYVAADADHRTSRVMELMGVVSGQMPELDPAADVASVGNACGACAPVTYVAALALAAAVAQERAAPVLCIGNLDPFRRDVAVVTPGSTV